MHLVKNAEVWAAGLKYDANNIYLATTYSETQNMTVFGNNHIANKAQNFEVVAQYQFDFGLRPSVAYLQSKGKDLGVHGVTEDLVEVCRCRCYLLLQQKHVHFC